MDKINYKGNDYDLHRKFDQEYLNIIIREEIDKFISEGLIKTYPLSSVSTFLNGLGYRENKDYIMYNDDNCFVINYISDETVESDYNKIIDKLQIAYGWIHATTTIVIDRKSNVLNNKTDFINHKYYGEWCVLNFEPKFDITSFQGNDKYRKFYHITPSKYLNNVSKIGLKPKSRNDEFSYDERIYITDNFMNSGFDNMVILMHNLRMRNDVAPILENGINKYIILEIDFTKCNQIDSLKNIEIYRDINHNGGYYVRQNIPPYVIKPIYEYIISGKKIIKNKI